MLTRFAISKIIALVVGLLCLLIAYNYNTNNSFTINGSAYGTSWSITSSEFIADHHHKNITHNLVQLCESCHHKVHNENLRIYGYHQTNDGIKLNYEYIDISKVE